MTGETPVPGVPAASPAAPFPSPFARPDLYDALFTDLDEDLPYYLGLARASGGPVLELGCGTGRVLLPTLEAGVDAEGLDLSAPMLDSLRGKARARGLAPRVHLASMTSFDLPRRFRLVTIPFNAFVHNLTVDDQLATLACCRRHLEPGGRLAFDVARPTAKVLAETAGRRTLEIESEHPATGLPVRLWDTRRLDPATGITHSRLEIEELDESGAVVAAHPFSVSMRWIAPAEMEGLLRRAGFARWRLAGDFEGGPVDADSGLLVVEAWNGDA